MKRRALQSHYFPRKASRGRLILRSWAITLTNMKMFGLMLTTTIVLAHTARSDVRAGRKRKTLDRFMHYVSMQAVDGGS